MWEKEQSQSTQERVLLGGLPGVRTGPLESQSRKMTKYLYQDGNNQTTMSQHKLNLKVWKNYTFSQAVFEGTNLHQYNVVIERHKRQLYYLTLTRRHVYYANMEPGYETSPPGQVLKFSSTTEEGIMAELRTLLDPSKYRIWSDGTLVDISTWEKEQATMAEERAMLGI